MKHFLVVLCVLCVSVANGQSRTVGDSVTGDRIVPKPDAFPPDAMNAEEAAELDVLVRILKSARADVEAMEKMTQPAGQTSVAEIVIRYSDRQAAVEARGRATQEFIKNAMARRGYGENSKVRFDFATKKFIMPAGGKGSSLDGAAEESKPKP